MAMEAIRQLLDPGSARSLAEKAGYCATCTGMLCTPEGIKARSTLPGYRHSPIRKCIDRARRGCKLCKIILHGGWERIPNAISRAGDPIRFVSRGLNDMPPANLEPDAYRHWKDRRPTVGGVVWLDGGLLTAHGDSCTWTSVITIAIMAYENDPAAKYYIQRPRYNNFLEGTIMDEASKWLADCVGNRHDGCIPLKESPLPTRVLDLDPSLGHIIRLRETKASETGNYAALSYCWGGPQPLTTIKSNIQILKNGIAIQSLPQTLQDAVHVTRRLGIRYLWIDALCIIQDSAQDKLFEIDNMGAIYRNSTVTIAAAHARKASAGFLNVVTRYTSEDSCTVPVYLPGHPKVGNAIISLGSHVSTGLPEPLRTRGWAFQEAVLSRCILIFSGNILHCHCGDHYSKFLNVGSIREYSGSVLYRSSITRFNSLESERKIHGDGWMSAGFLNTMWNTMLGDFTMRSLTISDDRLPALQGIANELLQSAHLSNCIDRTYVAGTWMACLPPQLIWERHKSGRLCPDNGSLPAQAVTNRSSNAPSWSWASVDCSVSFLSISSTQPYSGFSVLRTPSKSGQGHLEVECDIHRRGLDEFRRDSLNKGHVLINLDLDADELCPGATCVHYILLDWQMDPRDKSQGSPLWLNRILGIITCETDEGCLQRLGCFRWDINQSADCENPFNQRRRVKLV